MQRSVTKRGFPGSQDYSFLLWNNACVRSPLPCQLLVSHPASSLSVLGEPGVLRAESRCCKQSLLAPHHEAERMEARFLVLITPRCANVSCGLNYITSSSEEFPRALCSAQQPESQAELLTGIATPAFVRLLLCLGAGRHTGSARAVVI